MFYFEKGALLAFCERALIYFYSYILNVENISTMSLNYFAQPSTTYIVIVLLIWIILCIIDTVSIKVMHNSKKQSQFMDIVHAFQILANVFDIRHDKNLNRKTLTLTIQAIRTNTRVNAIMNSFHFLQTKLASKSSYF